jgi:SulP family sulfate permease
VANRLTPKLFLCLQDYSWPKFRADAGAGVVVGLVALPLAMAFAVASGLPPERGIYTAVIAGFLISALGGSRVQIGGPTGAFVVIVASIVMNYGYSGLAVATMMAGVLLLIMGFSGLGTLIKFVPYPVTTGFTSGIAVVIFSSQIKDFLGLRMGTPPAEFVAKWMAYFGALPTLNGWAVLIASLTTLGIALWPKSWQKLPASVVALVTASLAAWIFQLPVETIGSRFGDIPHSLPRPSWPTGSWDQMRVLFPSAVTIALLGAIESLLSAVVADGMIGGRHRSNMELVAQGVANLASPFFGGMPATGAIARTATNVKTGGRTPVAGIVHAAVLLIILMTAGPWASRIPLAALTGVLIMVCYHMFEWRSVRFLFSGPASDRWVMLTTFLLTVFIDITVAVSVGMVLAAVLFMKSIAELTQVKQLSREVENGEESEQVPEAAPPAGVEVFSIHGAFFFGAVHKLSEVDRIVAKTPRAFILDMTDVLHMDATGLHVLQKLHRDMARRGIQFIIAGIHAQPLMVLASSQPDTPFGKINVKATLQEAFLELK